MQRTRYALTVLLTTFGFLGHTVGPLRANPGRPADYPQDSYEVFDYDCYGNYDYGYEGYGDRAVAPPAAADEPPVVAPPVVAPPVEEEEPVVAEDPADDAPTDGYPDDGSDPCEYGCPYEAWYGADYEYTGDDSVGDDAVEGSDAASITDRLQNDLADLLKDVRHSTGQAEVLKINEQNDGLVALPEDTVAEDAAPGDEDFRYDDCGYCGWALEEPVAATSPAEDDDAAAGGGDSAANEAGSGVAESGNDYEYDEYGYDYDGYEYNDDGYDEAKSGEKYGYEYGEYDEYGYDCDDYECEENAELYGNEYDTDETWQDEAAEMDEAADDGIMDGAIENAMRVMTHLGGTIAEISQQVGGLAQGTLAGVSELPQIDTPESADANQAVEEDSLYWYSPEGDIGR